jgi:hypothetical protein
MRSMLTRGAATTELVVSPMSEDEQCQIIEHYFHCEPDLARWLVRQVGHKMSDVATNPLMLFLGARAIVLQGNASNPATVFETVIRDIAERCGYPDACVLEVGLGMAYAKLLDGQKRYCDTVQWVALLKEAAERLVDEGHTVSVRRLREFGSETGLVRSAPFDTVRPFHDSFADYLAAVALNKALAALPEDFGEHDRARARFLAQLSGVTAPLADRLTRDLPFTAVNAVPYEQRPPDASWLDETNRHVDQLLPAKEVRPNIAYWEDDAGKLVVTIGGDIEGWLVGGPPGKPVIASGWTFRLSEGQGPLTVAVRVWHRWLDQLLTPPPLSGVAAPHSLAESTAMLAAHSVVLFQRRRELTSLMELIGPDGNALTDATTLRIQFAVSDRDVGEERDRGVWFRERSELAVGEEVIVGVSDGAAWTGRGSVDSFVSTGPLQSAARELRQAINSMVGRIWL